MAMDREKVVRNAQRFKQNKQFQRAIDEYKRVLAADDRDIRTRQRLIELYALAGKKREAIEECLLVAEAYADQGFYLKAIAVLKQALRLEPESAPLWRQTGDMYLKQGLVGEALAAFKRGVDLLRRQGRASEAEQLLVRMEQTAPENAAIKVHLAELYLEDGRYEDFSTELSKLILQLRGEGRSRKLLHVVESFYEKSNRHASVLRGLAELYVELGEEGKALDVLDEGLSREPEKRELRLLALRARLALGHLPEAWDIALALHGEDPDDPFILQQLAAIAQARGGGEELTRAYRALAKASGRQGARQKEDFYLRKVLEVDPLDAEARLALGEVVRQPAAEGVEEPGGEGFQGVGEAGRPPGNDAVHSGLVEAELYLKYGIEPKAADKLRELTVLAPDNIEIRRKLRDLYKRQDDRQGWIDEQLCIAGLFLRGRRETEALRAYQAVLEMDPENSAAREGIEGLRPADTPGGDDTVQIDLGGAMAQVGEGGGGAATEGEVGRLTGADGEVLRQGLAQADLLEAQERSGEAVEVLLGLRRSIHGSPHVTARLERLGWTPPGADSVKDGYVDLQTEVLEGMDLRLGGEFEGFADFEVSELDDIIREFKSGIAERLDEGDFETHYNLGVAYREMGLMDEAAQEFQVAARSPDKARDAYASLAQVFRDLGRYGDASAALRMALAASSNTPEDQVAILYEMGDTAEAGGDRDRALHSFQRAAELDPGHRDVAARIRRLQAKGGG